MKLNHLNLPVPDVAEARQLFENFFDFQPVAAVSNDKLAVLHGSDGFVLVLMQQASVAAEAYPKAFHLGIGCDSPAEVLAKHAQLLAAGLVGPQPPRDMHGSFAFYLQAFGFLLIEVGCPASTT